MARPGAAHPVSTGVAGSGLSARPAAAARLGRVQLELADESRAIDHAHACRAADLAARLRDRARELGAPAVAIARRAAGILASAECEARAYLRAPGGASQWAGAGLERATDARPHAGEQSETARGVDHAGVAAVTERRARAAARAAAAEARRLTSWTQHEQSFPPDVGAAGDVDGSKEPVRVGAG